MIFYVIDNLKSKTKLLITFLQMINVKIVCDMTNDWNLECIFLIFNLLPYKASIKLFHWKDKRYIKSTSKSIKGGAVA